MTEVEVRNKIDSIFKKTLDLPGDFRLEKESNMDSVPGWDSLSFMDIVVQIEGQMGIRFAHDELAQLFQYGAIIDIVLKKLK